jgi:hypothetical protein
VSGRFAPLGGWQADPERPGYLRDPERPGWLRTPDGRWWSQLDVDNARAEVEAAAEQVELIEGVRRAALRRGLIQ